MFKLKNLLALTLSLFASLTFAGQTLQISQQALLTTLKESPEKILLIDARSTEEYQQGHIAGAINVSYDQVQQNLAKLAEFKNRTVVVYCRSGRRAAMAEQALAANGFSSVRHLSGDMNAWLANKLPVVSSKK